MLEFALALVISLATAGHARRLSIDPPSNDGGNYATNAIDPPDNTGGGGRSAIDPPDHQGGGG